MSRQAYQAARVIDGVRDEPWKNAVVVVEDGRIVDVSPAATLEAEVQVEDLGQVTITPGLIDAHVHLMWDASGDPNHTLFSESEPLTAIRTARNAITTLACGVTTVRDVGNPTRVILAAREAVKLGLFPGPTILAAGSPIGMTGGRPGMRWVLEVDGPNEALKAARQLIKAQVDCIKVMATGAIYTKDQRVTDPQLRVDEMQAIVGAAHNAGRRVAAHADSAKGVENALKAGVDTIEHGLYITDALLEQMADKGTYLVPTMSVYTRMAEEGEEAGIPKWAVDKVKQVVEVSTQGFEMAVHRGVPIAAGSDTGSPCHEHSSIVYELGLMVKFGMSAMDAIKAATYSGAKALGISDVVGTIEPGMRADLTIVEGNPLEDIAALKQVAMVVKDGQTFTPESLTKLIG